MRSVLSGLTAGMLACGTANAERFSNTTIGLSIEKPADWCVLSEQAVAKDHQTILAANPQMRAAIQSDFYTPLFAFTRYAGSQRGVTSTVKVETRPVAPVDNYSGQQLLRATLASIAGLATDAKVLTAPETVSLAGTPADHMAVSYTLKVAGASLPIASEMWVVRRGNNFVVVGTTYPPDNQEDRAAVMKVVNSLQLTP